MAEPATPTGDEPSDLDRVMGGQCIHGHRQQGDCLTCGMTRYLGVSLGRMITALLTPRPR